MDSCLFEVLFKDAMREAQSETIEDLKSDKMKQTVTGASSKEDLRRRLRDITNESKKKFNERFDSFTGQLMDIVPDDPDKRKVFEKIVVEGLKVSLKMMDAFLEQVFSRAIEFFTMLWDSLKNAVLWMGAKVTEFVDSLRSFAL